MSKIEVPANTTIKKFQWISDQDIAEVTAILQSGELSGFLATDGKEHHGGVKVKELEAAWVEYSGIAHAVTFNSWTSGLEASIAALELPHRSEVIVTPWTMSATVAAIVNNGLIPVFADISRESFNISLDSVADLISKKTRAIMAVDIFGKPCDFIGLRKLSDAHNLELVIDSAQAPSASRNGERSAEYASISGYSFNRHKHIQCGEGGIAVTSNLSFANKMRLYRNHSEVSSLESGNTIQGHNMRFGEIEAALILGQLARIGELVSHRVLAAKKIISGLSNLEGIRVPSIDIAEYHDFYIVGLELVGNLKGQRDAFIDLVSKAKLPGILKGYVNAHKLPQFSQFGREPLKNSEELHEKTFIGIYMCGVEWDEPLISLLVDTFTSAAKQLNDKKTPLHN